MYQTAWNEDALDDLKKIPKKLAVDIKTKVDTYLVHNPRELGKALQGRLKGKYRYRYGKYRVIYEIQNDNTIIIILAVGPRATIYEK